MRVSSITRPSSSGTLKSTRINTRRSLSGRSRIDILDMMLFLGSAAASADVVAAFAPPPRGRKALADSLQDAGATVRLQAFAGQ